MQMTQSNWLAEKFQEKRTHLRAVAYRILGSDWEAEDAVQEAWVRLTHSDVDSIENLTGWLTTGVARVCLDMLRSRKARKEEALEEEHLESPQNRPEANPAEEALLADSVGTALLIVLGTLTPAERVAFVLHDLFDLPFEEMGPIVGRSIDAARQLASRARRRVRGGGGGREDKAKNGKSSRRFWLPPAKAIPMPSFNCSIPRFCSPRMMWRSKPPRPIRPGGPRLSKARCGAPAWSPNSSKDGPWAHSLRSSTVRPAQPGSPVEGLRWLSCSRSKMGKFGRLTWSWTPTI